MKASPERTGLAARLGRRIAAGGPISVADYMAEANAHYYATRDPFGTAGDFVTAPEISQIFGELIGLWLADSWQRAGSPANISYVELGPGRGTLAADALRAMAVAGLRPAVELVETSPVLRRAQAERLPGARRHNGMDSLPDRGPLLVVANEFFDALPVRQLVATEQGWRERVVDDHGDRFAPVPGPPVPSIDIPPLLRAAPPGTIFETCPASLAIARAIGRRISDQGGVALIFDYGHMRTAAGDTLQAVAKHHYADPWIDPGECDLTAHVDFQALAEAAAEGGASVRGPRPQGEWLKDMGMNERAFALSGRHPERAGDIEAAVDRLAGADQMGNLFKTMALASPRWPDPAGFA